VIHHNIFILHSIYSPIGEKLENSENLQYQDRAIKAINDLLSEIGHIQIQKENLSNISPVNYVIDLVITIKYNGKKYKILAEIKSNGEPRIISQVSNKLKNAASSMNGYPVIIAPYISERGRKLCKELNLGFIDLVGNAYLRFDGILIDRWGKRNSNRERRVQKKLFSTKATWIIRKMFTEPDHSWTTMQLAEEAMVSTGYVNRVVNRLSKEGFVEKSWGNIRLINPGELLDYWRDNYNVNNQKTFGYYCPFKEQKKIFNQLKRIPEMNYALTLGAAASIIAPRVRSTDVYIYFIGETTYIKNQLELTPVEFGGNVYLIEPADRGNLFDLQYIKELTIVSNLQLYLDLYNYPMRGKEQADYLREKHMRW